MFLSTELDGSGISLSQAYIINSSNSYYYFCQHHHELHLDSCIYCSKKSHRIVRRHLNHTRGYTRQILDNLRAEDNLRREDKDRCPKVSSLRRFDCIMFQCRSHTFAMNAPQCVAAYIKRAWRQYLKFVRPFAIFIWALLYLILMLYAFVWQCVDNCRLYVPCHLLYFFST